MQTHVSATGAGIECYRAGYIIGIASVAALGGLLFGYDWVVIGGAKPFYEKFFQLDTEQLVGWANSCALLGCLLGSMTAGWLSDRFGRKKLMVWSAILFGVSSLLTGWAGSFAAFVVWRIAGGVAIGMASNISPTYIAEVSPASWRGRLVALNQLTIVIGILAAQVVNWLIAQPVPEGAAADMIRASWNGQYGWRWMFTALVVPSAVFFAGALIVPESPRWLARGGAYDAARRILTRIGGAAYADRAVGEIRASIHGSESSSVRIADLLAPGLRRALLVGCALAVLQQWSGINVIFNYAEEIYRGAGYGVSGILFNIVITGSINLVFTVLAMGFVDRAGRRALMLWGCAGIAASHLLLGSAYSLDLKETPVLVLTLAAIACYATSLAPVTWVLISEIFPNRVRGVAVSIAVSALWVACFILTFTFPILNARLGSAETFWIYAAICLGGWLFIRVFVPETKGKTLEEIETIWGVKPS
jgi:sugar porter (SP) family MFS transporter